MFAANQIYSGWQENVIILNALLAGVSMGTNGVACWFTRGKTRILHVIAAIIAVLYISSYAWLLLGSIDVQEWEAAMRVLHLFPWVFVWIAPALPHIRPNLVDQFSKAVAEELERRLSSDA